MTDFTRKIAKNYPLADNYVRKFIHQDVKLLESSWEAGEFRTATDVIDGMQQRLETVKRILGYYEYYDLRRY
jgi:hypothetical protein